MSLQENRCCNGVERQQLSAKNFTHAVDSFFLLGGGESWGGGGSVQITPIPVLYLHGRRQLGGTENASMKW